MSNPIRVLLVDDHPIMREGLAAALASQEDIQVIAQASDGVEAVNLFAEHKPDVTVMDLRLPKLSGTEAIQAIRAKEPDALFVVLTTFDMEEEIHRVFKLGVQAYLLKGAPRQQLLEAIRTVHAGGRFIPGEIAARLAEQFPREELSGRERQVLKLLARGASTEEIATELSITTHTVRMHVKTILAKLGARDRAHAVAIAFRRGLTPL
jgi:two-component system, NarL family, response regulator